MNSNRLASFARELAWLLALAVLGSVAIVAPMLVMNGTPAPPKANDPHWWPFWIVWEGFGGDLLQGSKIVAYAGLLGLGLVTGWLSGRRRWMRGMYLVAMLPLGSLVDASLYGDHNLLGIEWFCYGLLGLVPLLGSFIGARIPRRGQLA